MAAMADREDLNTLREEDHDTVAEIASEQQIGDESEDENDEHRELEPQEGVLEKKVETLNEKISETDTKVERHDKEISETGTKVERHDKKISEMDTNLKELSSKVQMLEAQSKEAALHRAATDINMKNLSSKIQEARFREEGILHKAVFSEICDDLQIKVPQFLNLAFGPLLGGGGFGRVYKVSGFPNQQVYSAKVLFDNISVAEEKQRETSILRKCNSKHILKLFTICQVPNLTKSEVLIMELMEGDMESYFSTSEQRISSTKPSNKSIIGILIQVARGLDYLHSFEGRIIHRDLKARNVLLCNIKDEIPVAKIGDFGLARFVDSMESVATMTGIAGTRYYLAPEVDDRSHQYNEKVDIFSFGHLMLSACIRQVIIDLPNVREVKDEIERRKRQLEKLKNDGPKEIEPIIVSCLQYPDFRSRPSAKELIESLERIKDVLNTPTTLQATELPTSTT